MQKIHHPNGVFIHNVFETLSNEKYTDKKLERAILESYRGDIKWVLDLMPGLKDLSLKDFSEKSRSNPESLIKVEKEIFFGAVRKLSNIGSIDRVKRTKTALKRLPKLISIVWKYAWQSLQMYQSERFKKSPLGECYINFTQNPTMRDLPILLMIYFDMREFVQIIKMDGITMDVEFLNNFQEYLDKLE